MSLINLLIHLFGLVEVHYMHSSSQEHMWYVLECHWTVIYDPCFCFCFFNQLYWLGLNFEETIILLVDHKEFCWFFQSNQTIVVLSFYRANNCPAQESETRCLNTKDEVVETDLVNSSNQEKVDEYEKRLVKNDLIPSTSKQEMEPNNRKGEVGKRQQTYSGPLMPSSVHVNSSAEKGRTTERFISIILFEFYIHQWLYLELNYK